MPRRSSVVTPPARRERGTGMIASDRGGYRAKITLNGEQYRKRFDTYEAADEWLMSLIRAQRGGRSVTQAATQYTVASWCREWLTEVWDSLALSTARDYDTTLGMWVYPVLGQIPLRNLDDSNIRQWKQHIATTPSSQLRRDAEGNAFYPNLSIQRQLYAWRILSKSLKAAVGRGLISQHPMMSVAAPSLRGAVRRGETQTDVRVHAMSDADYDKFFNYMEENSCEENSHSVCSLRWILAAQLGMRQGEVLALEWDTVNLSANNSTLLIKQHLKRYSWMHGVSCTEEDDHTARSCPSRVDGGLVIAPGTKAGNALTRRLSLPSGVVRAFEAHKEASGRSSGFVFLNGAGSLVNPRQDNRDWHNLQQKIQLSSRYRLHDLRHTAASRLAEIDLAAAQVILGHQNISTTTGYVHANDRVTGGALARLEEMQAARRRG